MCFMLRELGQGYQIDLDKTQFGFRDTLKAVVRRSTGQDFNSFVVDEDIRIKLLTCETHAVSDNE